MDYSLLLAIEVVDGVKKQPDINQQNRDLAIEKVNGLVKMKFTAAQEKVYQKMAASEMSSERHD